MQWPGIALGYVTYLAAVSLLRPLSARARLPLLLVATAAWSTAFISHDEMASSGLAAGIVAPALFLLVGYWLSGLLFVAPDVRMERWLLAVDESILGTTAAPRSLRSVPPAVAEYLELSYLLVYAIIPAGALTLTLAGHADQVGRFWTIVLLAEFACYGMLPWIQTRPPRVLEGAMPGNPAIVRRLNLRVTQGASIQANTIPSGHAAGAVAAALAVTPMLPLTGAVFLLLAASITIATVAGRYHYVLDAVLGVVVGVLARVIVG